MTSETLHGFLSKITHLCTHPLLQEFLQVSPTSAELRRLLIHTIPCKNKIYDAGQSFASPSKTKFQVLISQEAREPQADGSEFEFLGCDTHMSQSSRLCPLLLPRSPGKQILVILQSHCHCRSPQSLPFSQESFLSPKQSSSSLKL